MTRIPVAKLIDQHGRVTVGQTFGLDEDNQPFWVQCVGTSGQYYTFNAFYSQYQRNWQQLPGGRFGYFFTPNGEVVPVGTVLKVERAYVDPTALADGTTGNVIHVPVAGSLTGNVRLCTGLISQYLVIEDMQCLPANSRTGTVYKYYRQHAEYYDNAGCFHHLLGGLSKQAGWCADCTCGQVSTSGSGSGPVSGSGITFDCNICQNGTAPVAWTFTAAGFDAATCTLSGLDPNGTYTLYQVTSCAWEGYNAVNSIRAVLKVYVDPATNAPVFQLTFYDGHTAFALYTWTGTPLLVPVNCCQSYKLTGGSMGGCTLNGTPAVLNCNFNPPVGSVLSSIGLIHPVWDAASLSYKLIGVAGCGTTFQVNVTIENGVASVFLFDTALNEYILVGTVGFCSPLEATVATGEVPIIGSCAAGTANVAITAAAGGAKGCATAPTSITIHPSSDCFKSGGGHDSCCGDVPSTVNLTIYSASGCFSYLNGVWPMKSIAPGVWQTIDVFCDSGSQPKVFCDAVSGRYKLTGFVEASGMNNIVFRTISCYPFALIGAADLVNNTCCSPSTKLGTSHVDVEVSE